MFSFESNGNKLRKCKQLHIASKEFGVRRQTMVKWSKSTEEEEFCDRSKRSDAMPEEHVNIELPHVTLSV
jgi:hypothetical protein